MRICFGFILALLPLTAIAVDYNCTYGNLERRIEIVYEPGLAVPCEVHYYRDANAPDEREVLWRAQNETGYCEARTEELVARLQNSGWQCLPTGAEHEDEDDGDESDDLAPSPPGIT